MADPKFTIGRNPEAHPGWLGVAELEGKKEP